MTEHTSSSFPLLFFLNPPPPPLHLTRSREDAEVVTDACCLRISNHSRVPETLGVARHLRPQLAPPHVAGNTSNTRTHAHTHTRKHAHTHNTCWVRANCAWKAHDHELQGWQQAHSNHNAAQYRVSVSSGFSILSRSLTARAVTTPPVPRNDVHKHTRAHQGMRQEGCD